MDSKKDNYENLPEGEGANAPRARNRTVMLTPEMTGQLRNRIGKEGVVSRGSEEQQIRAAEIQAQIEDVLPIETQQSQPLFRPARPLQPTPQSPVRPEFFTAPHERQEPSVSEYRNEASPYITQGGHERMEPHIEKFANKDAIYWSKQNPIVGFLVSYNNIESGEAFELRQGRIIVTSEKAAHGDYLVIVDESVSPMHAILRITGAGEVQVLDQLSEYGTKIQRLGSDEIEDLSGERSSVGHGDVLFFGKRSFHVCMIVRND